jgi:hypothetical protein
MLPGRWAFLGLPCGGWLRRGSFVLPATSPALPLPTLVGVVFVVLGLLGWVGGN